MENNVILDSGERREFSTGAVRDIQEGKGRCDLLPLDVVANIGNDLILKAISEFMKHKDVSEKIMDIHEAIVLFIHDEYDNDFWEAMLDVSIHYENGCKKYGERNWEKGIPIHCYIDSALRHYFKYNRGYIDENHKRAFMWNLLCCSWTMDHHPELIDI